MAVPNPTDAPCCSPTTTCSTRVAQLIGRAAAGRQFWIMSVHGDGGSCPSPSRSPTCPAARSRAPLRGLTRVLAGLQDELATDLGPGSVILTLERIDRDAVLPADEEWAGALAAACARAGTALRGVYLSTDGGVRRL